MRKVQLLAWEFTNSTSQDEIEPALNEVKFKLKNNQSSYIYTDTCCCFKKVYKQCFPGAPIKLDLLQLELYQIKYLEKL